METFNTGFKALIASIERTLPLNPDIRGAIIIGSRARSDHPADDWSDLDMLICVDDPEAFLLRTDWFEPFGDVWLTFATRTPTGDPERRVMYAGGLDVDFAISPVAMLYALNGPDLPPDAVDLLRRGVRIVHDPLGLLTRVAARPIPPRGTVPLPGEASFLNDTHNFWYHTLWTAKHLRRGELWWAKACCDMHLKGLLNTMLTWHAQAHNPAGYDTWMGSRFLEEWADLQAVADLSTAFAHYDREDIARALRATMALYRRLEQETAARWGFTVPSARENDVSALVERLLAGIG